MKELKKVKKGRTNENEKLANNTPDYVDECEFEIVVYDESKEIKWQSSGCTTSTDLI